MSITNPTRSPDASASTSPMTALTVPQKRGPGRPKGSKNKPKDPNAPARSSANTKSRRNFKLTKRQQPTPPSSSTEPSPLISHITKTTQPAAFTTLVSPTPSIGGSPPKPTRRRRTSTAPKNTASLNGYNIPTSSKRSKISPVSAATRIAKFKRDHRAKDFWLKQWNTEEALGGFTNTSLEDLYSTGDDLTLGTFTAEDKFQHHILIRPSPNSDPLDLISDLNSAVLVEAEGFTATMYGPGHKL